MPHSYAPSRAKQEEAYHRSKYANGSAVGAFSSKINDILATTVDKELPMYKDKPNFPASRRRKMAKTQKLLLAATAIILCMWLTGFLPGRRSLTTPVSAPSRGRTPLPETELWKERQEAVKDAFITSWDGYEKYAWGMDEYHPISKRGRNMVEGGFGWMIVDALDTAMIMNLTSRVIKAREWIATSLTYTADHDVNTFETTIRMLGGLLSAQFLSTQYPHLAPITDDDVNQPGEDLYIEKATDLADRLLGAYESPTGIPYASINLNTSTGIPAGGGSSTAEAATLQLEMKHLSKLIGEPMYWQQAENIIKVIDDQHMQDGLLPIFINPVSGMFNGRNIRLGSRGDSYYEYLIKQFLQTKGGEPVYLELWEEALEGIKRHLITYTKDASLTVLAERPNGLDSPLMAKMDHLVCFMPGTIALAVTNGSTVTEAKQRLGPLWTAKHDENLQLAQELMKTCWGMYEVTPTGLAPEISYFRVDSPPRHWQAHVDPDWRPPVSGNLTDEAEAGWRSDYDIHAQDEHNLQRPETVESLFYLYQITQNRQYREWGWQMFDSFREHTKVVDDVTGQVYAYASLNSVMHKPVQEGRRRDNMESFWLAETLKYFYLLFSDEVGVAGGLPGLEDVVLNTEAHFLPRFDIAGSKVWKTGWTRQKKADVEKIKVQILGKPVPKKGDGDGVGIDSQQFEHQ
ncbi:hypothetical protein DV736_g1893, partial [Chaetothyriales sp. CBS 134916]